MDGYLFKHVFELEFDGYLITLDLQMSSTNVTILGNLNAHELADVEQVT